MSTSLSTDAKSQAEYFEQQFGLLIAKLRESSGQTSDAKFNALAETNAEVLGGLRKALQDFREANEPAWRPVEDIRSVP